MDERCSTLTIQRNVVYTPQSGVVVGTPKTAASVRVIPTMQNTLSLLLLLKAQRKRENPSTILADSFIFPGEAGIFEARDPSTVTRRAERFMKANGLPDLSPHDLRHTFATVALQNGVDIKTVSGMLDHYSAGFTLDT